ncbi:hypothetical protein HPB52_024626 [Rhipicephalus sanguineus]|uniref:Uncharacterized protein n=2 Tax=Rhipicephalus sanguineus TaxID=34632 RepID=A0A9D4TE63_RHISA|nr:hypothetical protein HPB52_024626 [Rhipicephalus sanguineus]
MTEALHEAETKAREEAAHRASAEELSKAAAEEVVEVRRLARNAEESLHEVESRLKAVHEELQICREKLVAIEQSRQAAMTSVEAKEEELSRLQQALKSAEEQQKKRPPMRTASAAHGAQHGPPGVPQEPLGQRLSRWHRPSYRMAMLTSRLHAAPHVAQRNRLHPQMTHWRRMKHRAVLADDNAEASPLKRLGNFVAGMLSMARPIGVDINASITNRSNWSNQIKQRRRLSPAVAAVLTTFPVAVVWSCEIEIVLCEKLPVDTAVTCEDYVDSDCAAATSAELTCKEIITATPILLTHLTHEDDAGDAESGTTEETISSSDVVVFLEKTRSYLGCCKDVPEDILRKVADVEAYMHQHLLSTRQMKIRLF